ncbi:hypothetical protein QKU58_gp059 [Pyramimonas orientalis virus]|uniref:Uncharacterized protein n=1 Tax=Pyramimonas orientalis virus 01B TaxID=3134525 RepID=A0A7M3UNK7_9VIRU|nr:hypothetical protein QKU58_gp059 [Pyramimonas orientalis virus]QOI90272.1 hypothetical protein HWQ62_00135 [Pyramimonas orientalis virus]
MNVDTDQLSFQNNDTFNFQNLRIDIQNNAFNPPECCEEPVVDECCEEPVVDECCEETVVDECCEEPVVDECCEETVVDECCEETVVDECCEEPFVTIVNNVSEESETKYSFLVVLNNINVNGEFPVKTMNHDVFLINDNRQKKGTKWENIFWLVTHTIKWKQYEHIWFPNSSLSITKDQVELFAQTICDNDVYIGQPCFKKQKRCYKGFNQIQGSVVHKTSFVDNMVPCFKKEFVENYLISLLSENEEHLKSGCGLDAWWSWMYPLRLQIVDVVEISQEQNAVSTIQCAKDTAHFTEKYKISLKL